MRKRFIAIVVAIIIAFGVLTGCGGAKITQSSTEVEETRTTVGKYFLYETLERQEYLNFLEGLDRSKYEVEDISIGYYGTSITGDYVCHYAVTYKTIE